MTLTRPIPRPPQAVLFDMDGVLVDTFSAWVAVVDECRRDRGLPALGPQGVQAIWGQGLSADCETLFPGEDPAVLAQDYDAAFGRQVGLIELESGAADAVAAIRGAGIPLALVTNSPVPLARRILQEVGLAGQFAVVAGGDEVRHGKPHPDLVLLALLRLGASAARSVLVGDTRLDVDAARAAEVPVIGYRIPGDARVESLLELPGLLGLGAR